jgi:exopolysaccharide biosynthesis polyprenyl glycosylphosphotransferase
MSTVDSAWTERSPRPASPGSTGTRTPPVPSQPAPAGDAIPTLAPDAPPVAAAVLAPAADRHSVARHIRLVLALTALLDLVVLAVSVTVAWDLRQFFDVWATTPLGRGEIALSAAPFIVVAWFLLLFAQGSYSARNFAAGPEEFRTVTLASVITAGLVGLTCYLLQLPLSRGFVLLAFLIGTPLLLLDRFLVRRVTHRLRRSGRLVHRVLAVGGPFGISEVVDALRRARHVGYEVVGACLPEGIALEPARFDVPVLGRLQDMRRLCEEAGADTVLIARGAYATPNELRRIAWSLEGSDIDLVVVPSLTDVSGPRIHMRPVAGLPLLHLEQPQAGEAAGWSKRAFDVTGALLALLLLSPVMAVVTLLIKLEGPGPILFVQPRVGRDGRTFGCYKFRSMFVDAAEREKELRERAGHTGALFKMPDDPRITRVGSFIRRYSVDELPQLVNVVRGDMSLVGPRPQQAWEVETYTDWEDRRLRVRPGMTGLWQVSGRSQLSFDEAIRLDLYYVDNWSMTADVVIMAKTVRAVVGSSGAY